MKAQLLTRTGVAAGTLTVIIANITSYELMKTALLAAVGTSVSYMVSALLQKITRCKRGNPSSGHRL